jgi:hypothetical protein
VQIAMSNVYRWFLMGVVGTIGLLAGFTPQMQPTATPSARAGDLGAPSAAKAAATSSSSSSSSAGGSCRSETKSSATVTTVVNGETKTVHQENADRRDECGRRSASKAEAVIDGSKADDEGGP